MIGIYRIVNNINGHCYIGQSNFIERRWQQHRSPYEWNRNPNNLLYKAFQKYGLENFTFEIIEECPVEELDIKEIYWIAFYNSYRGDGYNLDEGGKRHDGENHGQHKLTKQDVIDIRTRYANHERKMEVYELYKDRIGESGFSKIWKGENWKNIMPEIYTEENRKYHQLHTAMVGSKNGRARLNENDVRQIRLRRKNGELLSDVYKDYSHLVTKGSFTNVWSYCNWKNVVV